MHRTSLVGGLLAAGVLLGGYGIVQRADPAPTAAPLVTAEGYDGIRPIDEAVEFWRARVDASPGSFLDRTQYGLALAAQARATADLAGYAAAEAELRTALAASPGSTSAKLGLAQTLHSQHEFADAYAMARELWLAEPGATGALALYGDAALELGRLDEADDLYDRLAGVDRSAPVISREARLAYAAGSPGTALALAEEAADAADGLAIRPDERAFYDLQLGHFRFVTGDAEGAIAALERGLARAPLHPGLNEKLAFVLASVGRTDDAIARYQDLLTRTPAADLHGSLAVLLREQGDHAGAAAHERAAAELAAEAIDLVAERRHLAGYFVTRDARTAVELAELDLADRQDAGAYDMAAWALLHAGRPADAQPLIERALGTGIRDAAMLAHAGTIAAALGDTDRAIGHLREAFELNRWFHPTEAPAAAALLAELQGEAVALR